MIGSKEAFVGVEEVQDILNIGKTKAYAIIKSCNNELEKRGFIIIRGKCPRKYFEQKIYGYSEYYNPEDDLSKSEDVRTEDTN